MIEMWDELLGVQDRRITEAIASGDGGSAFAYMHGILDHAWAECSRVLRPGGFLCINIGDAVRSLGGDFRLYTNHSRITGACEDLGLVSLPAIHWRKPTNAPTKFMGSGMLPAGAYVTLEHEYILIFRKGSKRRFSTEERERRRRSAYFWEERNLWFSDTWDFLGVRQAPSIGAGGGVRTSDQRARSGAFPLELAFRLVNMYSLIGDTVLDPFLGTGTTVRAAIASARSSIGYEVDRDSIEHARSAVLSGAKELNERQRRRMVEHERFLVRRRLENENPRETRYENDGLATAVVTAQERELTIPLVSSIEEKDGGVIVVDHEPLRPHTEEERSTISDDERA